MISKQLLIVITFIICHQCIFLDSNVITSNQIIPAQYLPTCDSQLPQSYFQYEQDNLNQIKHNVKSSFKTDVTHFILKIVFFTEGDKQPLLTMLTSLIGQFKKYLIGFVIGLVIMLGIFIYWIYCIIDRKFILKTKKQSFQISKPYFNIILITFIVLSSIGAIIMAFGLYQNNVKDLTSTIICRYGYMNTQQPFKDIQAFSKTYTQYYSSMKPLMLEENRLNFMQTVDYSKKLLMAVQQSKKADEKFLKSLREAVANLNDSFTSYKNFRQDNIDFNTTLQLIRQRMARYIIYRHMFTKYTSKYISFKDLPSKFNTLCTIFYVSIFAAFVYVSIIGGLLLAKNKKILFTKSHSIPFFLTIIVIFSFVIAIILSILMPSLVLAGSSVQHIWLKNQMMSYPPNVNYSLMQFTYLKDKVSEFIKILFNRDYNVQNIFNGSIHRSAIALNRSLSIFQKNDDNYLQKLFKEAESKVDPVKLQQAIYNIKYFQRLYFQKSYAKWLMVNIKQSLASIKAILKAQLLNNPKISTKKSKIENFLIVLPVLNALIIESSRTANLFKIIGYIALFTLICQLIILKALTIKKASNSFKTIYQLGGNNIDEQLPLQAYKSIEKQSPKKKKMEQQ